MEDPAFGFGLHVQNGVLYKRLRATRPFEVDGIVYDPFRLGNINQRTGALFTLKREKFSYDGDDLPEEG